MKPQIVFANDVPRWLQSMVKRWYVWLRLEEWAVDVEILSHDELQGTDEDDLIHAITFPLPEYLRARIVFSEELTRQDAEQFVVHELLHLHLAGIELTFSQCWDGRKRLDRERALKLVAHKIEETIERIVRVLL